MKFENSASLRKKKTLKILNVTKNWKDPSIKQILFFGSILVICFTEINIYIANFEYSYIKFIYIPSLFKTLETIKNPLKSLEIP